MKLPQARQGMKVMSVLTDVIDYLRANTIRNVIGGKLRQSSSGITIEIDRQKPGRASGASHPFKITVTDDDINVEWGAVTSQRWFLSTGVRLETIELVTAINSAALKNNPLGAAVGAIALSATCGVWLKVDWTAQFYSDVPWFATGTSDNQSNTCYPSAAQIITDTTNTDYDDGPTLSTSATTSTYHYIGKITVTDGVPAVMQWRKSDITLQGHVVTDAFGV